MKQIWKYQMDSAAGDVQEFNMPEGAEVLSFQSQHEIMCLWVLVDPGAMMVGRKFRIAGTGHQIAELHCGTFIGTAQLSGGSLIFHCFEVTP